MKQRKLSWLHIIFIGLGILICAKMLLFGLSPDEEYQITMSYRLAQGDGLFYKSWDTIQTSGFLNYFLIKGYLLFGTTTHLVLFLRFVGLLLQLATAYVLYRRIKRVIPPIEAFAAASFSFFAFPKMIASPDFSNMLLWFQTLMLCFLWDAYDTYRTEEKLNYPKILLASLMMSASVLSQACFILIPITIVLLCVLFPGRKWKANLIFFGTCALTAVLYVSGIILANGFANVMQGIRGILSGDITHATGANIIGQAKIVAYAKDGISILLWLGGSACIAFLLSFIACRIQTKITMLNCFALFWNGLCALVTLFNWLIKRTGYDGLKLYIPCILCTVLIYWLRNRKRNNTTVCPIPFFGVLLGIGIFCNVLFVSNVPLINNVSFLLPSVLWGMILLSLSIADAGISLRILLICTASVAAAGTLFTLQSSPAGSTIFDCDGQITEGPAKGVMTARSVADVYNAESASFRELVPEGSTALLVTNFYYNTLLYYCYLENDVNISHYSVNSTPTFLQILEGYWMIYPDKFPDVIVVNNSTVYTIEYGWIFDYIQHYYGYTKTVETEYSTYYFK